VNLHKYKKELCGWYLEEESVHWVLTNMMKLSCRKNNCLL